jgi:ABC-2 type transport system permease protein
MTTTIQSLSRPTLGSHLRLLIMIAVKDWHNYWRYPVNALSQLLHPLIWLTPVYFMGLAFSVNGKAYGFAAYSGTTDYVSFVLLGAVLNNFIMTVFWGMGFALKWDMDTGVLESTWMTPAPRPLLLIGRTFASLFTTTISSLVMLAIAALLFGFKPTGNALLALIPVIPMLVGLYGFGIAFAAIVLMMRDANALVDMASYLVGLFSGSQFPVQALPGILLPISLALPLTYGFDAVRAYMLNTTPFIPIEYEIGILVVFMFVMVWLGIKIFSNMERKVRQRGTLGQH